MDQVREAVLTNQIAKGEQLPSVRQLSVDLGVNPMTISKAYSLLEAEGLIERKAGIGLFVKLPEGSERKLQQRNLLETSVRAAALQAVRLDMTADDACKLLREHIENLQKQKG